MKISPETYKIVRDKQDFLKSEFKKKYGSLSTDKYNSYLQEDFFVLTEGIKEECIRQSAAIFEYGAKHFIYADFIDELDNNAFAESQDGYSFIGFNIGTWVKLKLLFDNVLTNLFALDENDLLNFSKIYNSESETENQNIKNAFNKNEEFTCKDLQKLLVSYDSDIEKTSINLTIICLEFLFCHEFMHITLGHTGFSKAQNWGKNEANEMPIATESGESFTFDEIKMKNAMELQADLFAAQTIGENINLGRLFALETKENKERLVWQFSFALTTLFCAFDFSASNIKHYKFHNHPHPRLRLINIFSGFQTTITNFESQFEKSWLKAQELVFLSIRKLGLNVRFFEESIEEDSFLEIIKDYQASYDKMKDNTIPYRLNDFMI